MMPPVVSDPSLMMMIAPPPPDAWQATKASPIKLCLCFHSIGLSQWGNIHMRLQTIGWNSWQPHKEWSINFWLRQELKKC